MKKQLSVRVGVVVFNVLSWSTSMVLKLLLSRCSFILLLWKHSRAKKSNKIEEKVGGQQQPHLNINTGFKYHKILCFFFSRNQ